GIIRAVAARGTRGDRVGVRHPDRCDRANGGDGAVIEGIGRQVLERVIAAVSGHHDPVLERLQLQPRSQACARVWPPPAPRGLFTKSGRWISKSKPTTEEHRKSPISKTGDFALGGSLITLQRRRGGGHVATEPGTESRKLRAGSSSA